MAVVDDTDVGRTRARRLGRLGWAPKLAVERAVIAADELDIDTSLLHAVRGEDRQARHVACLDVRQFEAHTLSTGLLEECLRLVDVLHTLLDGCAVEVRVQLEHDVVVRDRAVSAERLVDHLLAIERPGNCLPHLRIHHGALIALHPQLAMRSGLQLDDVHVRIVEQNLALVGRELGVAVGFAAGDCCNLCGSVLDEDELDGVERRLATPPSVVTGVLGARLDVERVELPWTRATDTRLEVVLDRPRGRRDQRLRVVGRDEVREVTIGGVECKDDRQIVGCSRATRAERARQSRVAGFDQLVHRGDDVGGRERRAVLPHDAFAQLEGPGLAVRAARPLSGELRDNREVRCRAHEILEHLGADVVRHEVDHRDRVDTLRTWGRHRQLDRTTGLDCNGVGDFAATDTGVCCSFATTAAGTAAGCDDRADRGERQAENSTALNEVTAVDLALRKRLDEVELERVRFLAERVQLIEIGHTRSLLRSRMLPLCG